MTEQATHTNQVDVINTGLIILALILAVQLPFHVFLYAYAILGPLHYITEINWLREKQYFVKDKRWPIFVLVLVSLIVLPHIIRHPRLIWLMDSNSIQAFIFELQNWANGFILLSLLLAIGLAFFKKWQYTFLLLLFGTFIAYQWNKVDMYMVIVGLLIPTLIHVYLFTVLFMLYGAMKTGSFFGYLNVIFALLVPFVISGMNVDPSSYLFSDAIKETYINNGFQFTNMKTMELIGLSDGQNFHFDRQTEIKFQIFIAFAYLYHYFNWFSKTTTIEWHKHLTAKKSILLVALWLVLVSLFWIDYKTGVLAALFLSFLHVMLEFPVNAISLRALLDKLAPSSGVK